jgi:hypothetical protein
MAYGYEDPDREGMSTGAKIAIALGVLIGLPVIAAFAYGIYITFLMTPDQKFERMLAAEPEVMIFVEPLKKNYPEEYEEFKGSMLSALNSGNGEMGGRLASMGFMNGFAVRHAYEAALASDERMKALLDAHVGAFEVFGRNSKACESAMRQVPLADDKLSQKDKLSLIRFSGSFVLAAAAGRDHPLRRERMTPADQLALVRQLAPQGVTPFDLQRAQPGASAQEESQRRCTVLYKLFKTVQGLPREQSVRVYAQMLGAGR